MKQVSKISTPIRLRSKILLQLLSYTQIVSVKAFTGDDLFQRNYYCPGKAVIFSGNGYSTVNHDQFICHFCSDNLFSIVSRVCCGQAYREKREAKGEEFWFGNKTEDRLKILHPNDVIISHRRQDCLDDLKGKHSSESIAASRRMKRSSVGDSATGTGDAEDEEEKSPYQESIINGGKGRTTVNEMLEKMTCEKTVASTFLLNRSLVRGSNRDTHNRNEWKHTSLDLECCSSEFGCSTLEVQESYLQEECCAEGCVIEEIHESCGSFRWDKKDDDGFGQIFAGIK